MRPRTAAGGCRASVADVDPRFLDMLIAYEDRRFRSHAGVDPLALMRAAWHGSRIGEIVSGGSTLTMQVARLLEPRSERTLAAKLRQMVRAVQLERALRARTRSCRSISRSRPMAAISKACARPRCPISARSRSGCRCAEAALLVALPQSPEARRPDRSPERARARARPRARPHRRPRSAFPRTRSSRAQGRAVPTARTADARCLRRMPPTRRWPPRPRRSVHRLTIDARLQGALEALARERAASLGARHLGRDPRGRPRQRRNPRARRFARLFRHDQRAGRST